MSDTSTAASDDDLDASILAHDAARTAYILRNRAFRRRVAVYLLVVFLVGGCGMIAAGLASDVVAKRINELSSVIGTFMASIAALLSAYFGAGAFDNRSMLGGGGYGGYGGGLSSFSNFAAPVRPRLTPAAGAAADMHRSPDGQ